MISEADGPCFDIYEVCKPALRDSSFSCKPYFELKKWTFLAGKLYEIVPQSGESHLYDLSNLDCLKSDPNNSIRFSWKDQLHENERIFASGDRETVLKCLVEGCARAHHIADRTELFRDADGYCPSPNEFSRHKELVHPQGDTIASKSMSSLPPRLNGSGSYLFKKKNSNAFVRTLFKEHQRYFRLLRVNHSIYIEWAKSPNSKSWKQVCIIGFDANPSPTEPLVFAFLPDNLKEPIIQVRASKATKDAWIHTLDLTFNT